ncbi:NTP transferase domain-containing protein [Demequina sp. NBRC 110057]|uniref:nucleotidyltransferase family protein n=1 Tax=Demequina sp. NBRC 110057 TaxID=1570346 RepID=UPI0009FDF0B6|nr:NTP transferase domain-containing protein [Demequina sp. NBRC 110057]
MSVTGIVLAAGAGSRAGGPKVLRTSEDGTPWLHLACAALRDGGCREVIVVLGAQADAAAALVPRGALPVVASDWAEGQSASLKVGLAAAATSGADAAVLSLVDMPNMTAAAVARVIAAAADDPRDALARARYGDSPGHPVYLGRDHWGAIGEEVTGDSGAREYLESHLTLAVDCTDLGGGEDVDA